MLISLIDTKFTICSQKFGFAAQLKRLSIELGGETKWTNLIVHIINEWKKWTWSWSFMKFHNQQSYIYCWAWFVGYNRSFMGMHKIIKNNAIIQKKNA